MNTYEISLDPTQIIIDSMQLDRDVRAACECARLFEEYTYYASNSEAIEYDTKLIEYGWVNTLKTKDKRKYSDAEGNKITVVLEACH